MADTSELDQLLGAVEKLKKYQFKDETEKRRAMLATQDVSESLKRPIDTIMEIWGDVSKHAAIKIGLDVELFKKWSEAAPVQTAAQLAELTGKQPLMISTVLKHLASWHIINIEGPDKYSQTQLAKDLVRPEVAECINFQFECFNPMFHNLPAYLKATQYKRPTDPAWSAFSYAKHFDGSFFDYVQMHGRMAAAFDGTMRGYTVYRGSWVDSYPVDELVKGASEGQALVVDIGGSTGHDLMAFADRFPDQTKDRMVLQDLPHVIEKADIPVKKMVHDFFTLEPIQGARAYFLHSILHDWPDDKCREIMNNIKPAMKQGSRILINEMVVPAASPSLYTTTFDFIMMTLNGGRERDETAWHELFNSVGLKITKIWRASLSIESVIEVELA